MNWRTILTIARKDIVDALRNNNILGMLMIPVLASLLLHFVFPASTATPRELTVFVYDPGSSRFISQLRMEGSLHLLPASSSSAVPEEVERQNAIGGIVVPEDFDTAVDSGESPDLTVYLNRESNARDRVEFQQLVERQVLLLRPLPANIDWTDVPAQSQAQSPVAFNFENFLFDLTLVMTLCMIGGLVVPLLLVEEKETKTMDYLLVSPADPADIILGKTLTGLFYNVLVIGVLLGLNRGWRGDWPLTFTAIVLGMLFMVAIGLLMGSLFRNTIQVNTWGSVILLILMVPGMLTTGIYLSSTLESILRLTPTYSLVRVLNMSLAGEATMANTWQDMALLGGYVLIAFLIAIWSLRRREK